jgi:gamma-glutamyltranspeptidase/glutathione hydrolase
MRAAAVVCRRGLSHAAHLLIAMSLSILVCGGFALLDVQSADAAKPARHGMVVAVSPPGADTGRDILQKGGNAVDAAVATAFAMAVTYPAAGNIGGGGFMLIFPGGKNEPVLIDYREKAPLAARKTMFTKKDSWYSHKAVGVPGTVRGLALAHARFGKLPWKDVVMPAVKLAEDGFLIDEQLSGSLNWIVAGSASFPELRRVLGKDGGANVWEAGDRLVQKDLAKTLRRIAERGPDGFYKGTVAEALVAEMKRGDGLITLDDLAGYEAKARKPIHGTYRGFDVYGPPPPSSGGICLVEMLNVLENFDLRKQGRFSPETLHVLIETMRRAYCDRARYLGDTDFVKVPAFLTAKNYARKLAQSIDPKKATRSEDLAKDIPLKGEGDSTTHFSVIDNDGMAVANTYTLERSYGSRIVVKGAGFLLNNEMMDFNWFPGETTRGGGIGTEPNQVAPGKRMLSSQTPTLVAKNGKVILVTGSPGSRTIINTVLCVVVNVVDFDMDVRAAVDAPRLHHAWFPDTVFFEGVCDYPQAVARLEALGHSVRCTRQGDAHSIWLNPKTGRYEGAADRRINGKVSGF